MSAPAQLSLFDSEDSRSPKDLWLRKHGLIWWKDGYDEWCVGSKSHIQLLWNELGMENEGIGCDAWQDKFIRLMMVGGICYGCDESLDDAIVDWAEMHNHPLWNEEDWYNEMKGITK